MKLEIKIEIKSRDVLTKRVTAAKTGRVFEINEQLGYVELEKPYPLEVRVPLESPDKAYSPGTYLVDPSCVYVNRYGQLQLGRLKLSLISVGGHPK
jgi:Helix-destabilising protein